MQQATFKQFLLEYLPPEADKKTVPDVSDNLVLVHGSSNPDLTLDDIQIVRSSGQKQGRSYGGLYAMSQKDLVKAQRYATMTDGTPTLYHIQIKDGINIYQTNSDVTRLSPVTIDELVKLKFGILVGKDPRGYTEWVIVDKNAIAAIQH